MQQDFTLRTLIEGAIASFIIEQITKKYGWPSGLGALMSIPIGLAIHYVLNVNGPFSIGNIFDCYRPSTRAKAFHSKPAHHHSDRVYYAADIHHYY